MDEATWAALAATLTLLGLVWTWLAFRRRGAANGLRALGIALLPAAAWLTGTLEMFTEIAGSVADWATGLVLDPLVWAGVVLSGLSITLLVVSGVVRDRQLGRARDAGPAAAPASRRTPLPPAASGRGSAPLDDDLAEIEELLKRRGIG